jgi:PilZ domain
MAEPETSIVMPEATITDSEGRSHSRFVCVEGNVLRLAIRPQFKGRLAILVDVSEGGIAFVMDDALEPGTVLAFEVKGAGENQAVGRLARVRHSRPHPVPADAPWLPKVSPFAKVIRNLFGGAQVPKPQAWLVGCQFDRPLAEAEVKQLLEELAANEDS